MSEAHSRIRSADLLDLFDALYLSSYLPVEGRALEILARIVGCEEASVRARVLDGPERADRMELVVPVGDGWELVLRVAVESAADRGLIERLVPHFARALGRPDDTASAALDRIALPVLVVTNELEVSGSNRSARKLLDGDPGPLRIDKEGVLTLRDSVDERRFRDAVRAACPPGRGGRVTLEHDDRPIEVILAPLPAGLDRPCCLVVLHPVGGPIEVPPRVVSDLYGLTPAEARVTSHLIGGLLPRSIADEMGLSYETVRSYLKSIFEKLGTTRQTDLIRLVLTGAGALDWSSIGQHASGGSTWSSYPPSESGAT